VIYSIYYGNYLASSSISDYAVTSSLEGIDFDIFDINTPVENTNLLTTGVFLHNVGNGRYDLK
jgi:hypothetical protein